MYNFISLNVVLLGEYGVEKSIKIWPFVYDRFEEYKMNK